MFFMISLLLTIVVQSTSSEAQGYNIECLWCLNVVFSAEEYFGDNITAATNLELDEYFERTCHLDQRKSPLLAGICYEMFENHKTQLYNDLRNNVSAVQTCLDCGFCESTYAAF